MRVYCKLCGVASTSVVEVRLDFVGFWWAQPTIHNSAGVAVADIKGAGESGRVSKRTSVGKRDEH